MARIGKRTYPGRWSVGSWKNLEAFDAQQDLEQQVVAFERLTVVRCVYRRGTDFSEHYHPQEQITIVEQGVLEFQIGDETIQVGRGHLISVEPEVPHATRVSNGSPQAVALNLFIRNRKPERSSCRGTGIHTVVRPRR